MKSAILPAFLVVALFTLPDTAEARARAGKSQFLEFVASTEMPDPSGTGTLSLCQLKTKRQFFGLPLYYEAEGYAMAPNNCVSEQYYGLEAEKLAEGQGLGLFPADLEPAGTLTVGQRITGYLTMAIGGVVLLLAALGILAGMRKAGKRKMLLRSLPGDCQRLVDVMCSIARIDGKIEVDEIDMIVGIAEKFTGARCDPKMVAEIAALSKPSLQSSDYYRFGKGLDMAAKETLLRAAMLVAIADGQFEGREKTFVGMLTKGLKISDAQVGAIFQSVTWQAA